MRFQDIEQLVVNNPNALDEHVKILRRVCILQRMLKVIQGRQQCLDDSFLFIADRIADLFGHTLLEIRIVGADPLELCKKLILLFLKRFYCIVPLFQFVFLRLTLLLIRTLQIFGF